MSAGHYIDPWNGRHKNTYCSASRCRSWAVAKYSVDNTIIIGDCLVIGYYCRAHIDPIIKAYPEDNKPSSEMKS